MDQLVIDGFRRDIRDNDYLGNPIDFPKYIIGTKKKAIGIVELLGVQLDVRPKKCRSRRPCLLPRTKDEQTTVAVEADATCNEKTDVLGTAEEVVKTKAAAAEGLVTRDLFFDNLDSIFFVILAGTPLIAHVIIKEGNQVNRPPWLRPFRFDEPMSARIGALEDFKIDLAAICAPRSFF
ncbi:hypothetical protein [Mesorhizobium sp. ISC11]|uniref:hypothetical protein n=1 Tax=Mesorhizobium sp. ISC11 TaxID=3076428 RepID=UPI00301D65A6